MTTIRHIRCKLNQIIPSPSTSLGADAKTRSETATVDLVSSILEPSNLQAKPKEQVKSITRVEGNMQVLRSSDHDCKWAANWSQPRLWEEAKGNDEQAK